MEEFKSNAEIRNDASDWVTRVRRRLDRDSTGRDVVLGLFLEPWTLAVTIGEVRVSGFRYRQVAPNPSPRLSLLQVTHYQNLLDWPGSGFSVIGVRPDNLFDPPPRAEMLEELIQHLGPDVSIGDVVKIEGGWAVAVTGTDEVPGSIAGNTLRFLTSEEIRELPPATQTGERTVTVASPRLDAVAAVVLKPSREKIKKHIESGGILLNYEPAKKSSTELWPNDVVAVRGAGRFRVVETIGHTKKGRVKVRVDLLNGA